MNTLLAATLNDNLAEIVEKLQSLIILSFYNYSNRLLYNAA